MNITEAYDRHVDKVYSFFYVKCFDKTVAEDLTSQTFMAVLEKSQDPDYVVQDEKKFIYGVMRNIWLMYLREKYRRNEQAVEDIEDFAGFVDDEVGEYESMTVKQRAEMFINKLPDKQRDVVAMRLLEGLSIKQICNTTGRDKNYVKTTYKRGVVSLKRLISEEVL